MALLAWTLPDRWQAKVARALGRGLSKLRTGRSRQERAHAAELFGSSIDHDTVFNSAQEHVVAEWLLLLRLYRPGGSVPEIDLVGAEHIDAALTRGHGAVLWVIRSSFSQTIAKVALHEAGYEVTQLSRPDHGFSQSRFGMTVLNPIRTKLEDRFLAGRVVISKSVGAALGRLSQILSRNGLVSIAVGGTARRTEEVACLAGTIRLPLRPLRLAREAGSAVLPVAVEAASDGSFVTTIHADLLAGSAQDDTAALHRLAELIAFYVAKAPDQFAPPLLAGLL